MHRYLDQLSVRLRPNSLASIDTSLRLFAGYLVDHHPDVTAASPTSAAPTSRATRPGWPPGPAHRRPSLAKPDPREAGSAPCAAFFARIDRVGHHRRPAPSPVLAADLPIKDDPLPRFLDDAASAKLLAAARAHPDPFTRPAVELLARTGMRKGELLGLTVDAVVQIGSAVLAADPGRQAAHRPLHPAAPPAQDAARPLARPPRPTGPRRTCCSPTAAAAITASRVAPRCPPVATAAGIGHVHPHQLRHTLATQAINRGMSLEAIAALLGHKSLSMTLVYARIADRTVADEYFAVTEKVEALYDQPRQLPADAEGTEMAQAPPRGAPAHARQRLLRPTRRARLPLRVDLRVLHLLRHHHRVPAHPATQRDDAAAKGQIGRQKIFDGLLDRLDQSAS